MKFTISASLVLFASSAFAHTWLECVDTVIHNEREARDPSIRATPQYECKGYPRNKLYDGDWIEESSRYSYAINNANSGLDIKYACRQDIQGQFGQEAPGKPMITARPGQKLNMRFWGNGHSDYHYGSPRNADPGLVRVYWAGQPEKEIKLKADLTEKYWIQGAQSNFSANSITWRDVTPMIEPGNFMEFTLPKHIQNGVHAMVFAWANMPGTVPQPLEADVYNNYWKNSFTTCFDVRIEGSDYTETVSDAVKISHAGYDARKAEMAVLEEDCSKPAVKFGGEACEGSACPPCRDASKGGEKPVCYDYKTGTTECPWQPMSDCGPLRKRNVLARSHARKHRRARRV